jgi:GTP cyclohydrolase I
MSLLENLWNDSNKPFGNYDLSAAIENSSVIENKVGKGAHNQRVNIRVDVEFNNGFDLNTKEIIKGIEDCASAGVYPILKRPDEKWVTERAYERPRFVEDIVREIAVYLDSNHKDILNGYSLRCVADESIHQHSAIAYLSKNWKLH